MARLAWRPIWSSAGSQSPLRWRWAGQGARERKGRQARRGVLPDKEPMPLVEWREQT